MLPCAHDTSCTCGKLVQEQLASQGIGDEDEDGDGVQLDPAQLAEYRKLKADADVKTSRLLQEKAPVEAQLKVR